MKGGNIFTISAAEYFHNAFSETDKEIVVFAAPT